MLQIVAENKLFALDIALAMHSFYKVFSFLTQYRLSLQMYSGHDVSSDYIRFCNNKKDAFISAYHVGKVWYYIVLEFLSFINLFWTD